LYNSGRWEAGNTRLPTILPSTQTFLPWRPPQLGPQQLLLTFYLRPGNRSFFLADPVAWRANQPTPIVSLQESGPPLPWQWLGDGTFYADLEEAERFPYQQHWHPSDLPDLSPPFVIVEPDPGPLLRALTQNPLPRLQEYADNLIRQWIRAGRLPADLIDPVLQRPRRQYHGQLARLLCEYLRSEAGLQYTTNLRITRSDLDPIEDFLFHSQAGHCERFASALVLLLRSQGIPAQLILGCKGCEPLDQPGRYLVRHEHAHAWVECLLEEFQPPLRPGMRPVSRWLSLDPTPASDPSVSTSGGTWLQRTHQEVQQWFRDYLVEFTPEQQRQAWIVLGPYLRWLLLGIGIAWGIALAGSTLYRLWQHRRRPAMPPSRQLCAELVDCLTPLGVVPLPGETIAKWAERVAARLLQDIRLAPYADLPLTWVHTYYAERFGGRTFSTEHWTALRQRLQELSRQLRPMPATAVNSPGS
jgi:transglutaminase-like putative cysteine protease